MPRPFPSITASVAQDSNVGPFRRRRREALEQLAERAGKKPTLIEDVAFTPA